MWTVLARDFLEDELNLIENKKMRRLDALGRSRIDSGIFEQQAAVILELIQHIESDFLHILLKKRLKQVQHQITRLQELGREADYHKLCSAREEKETLTELFKRWIIRLEQDSIYQLTNIIN